MKADTKVQVPDEESSTAFLVAEQSRHPDVSERVYLTSHGQDGVRTLTALSKPSAALLGLFLIDASQTRGDARHE